MDDYYVSYTRSQRMTTAALILSIVAALFFSAFYLAIPLAAIAIILALLSRGNAKMNPRGRIAVWTACLAITFSGAATAYVVYQIWNNPAYYRQFQEIYNELYNRYYGGDMDDPYTSDTVPYDTPEQPNYLNQRPNDLNQQPELYPAKPQWTIEGGEQI